MPRHRFERDPDQVAGSIAAPGQVASVAATAAREGWVQVDRIAWARRLAGRCLRLVAAVVATSLLLAGVTVAGLVPVARQAAEAVEDVGEAGAPAGRLLARPPTRAVVYGADGSGLAVLEWASPARAAAAKRQPLGPRLDHETVRFPYVVDAVTRALLGDHALDGALGPVGSAARRRAVFEGGLRVRTRLWPADQRQAEQAVEGRLAGSGLGGALVSLDPASGAVVAMVGGSDFARSKVNLATGQGGGGGFPPGSSFKVFYLVAALEQGIPLSTSFDTASPVTVTAPACPTGYTVHNAEPALAGRMALAQATAESVNTYYA